MIDSLGDGMENGACNLPWVPAMSRAEWWVRSLGNDHGALARLGVTLKIPGRIFTYPSRSSSSFAVAVSDLLYSYACASERISVDRLLIWL